ncbi:MAG: hypothetical protein GXY77_12720 [Fibrobacter sp.]|nr:hypothetical protein [Fibrobacter sp.]
MKCFILTLVFFIFFCNQPTSVNDNPDPNNNFSKIGSVSFIQVEYYDSLVSLIPSTYVNIFDKDTIEQIVNLLNSFPDSGDINIKWNQGVTKNNLILIGSSLESDTIVIIGNRVKTRSTLFFKPMLDEEKQLIDLVIDSTLQ